jgi:hypothetical protein
MKLLDLPNKFRTLKLSFPLAGCLGYVFIGFSIVAGLVKLPESVAKIVFNCGMASFLWSGPLGIPVLLVLILAAAATKNFDEAANTLNVFVINIIPVGLFFGFTPLGRLIAQQ